MGEKFPELLKNKLKIKTKHPLVKILIFPNLDEPEPKSFLSILRKASNEIPLSPPLIKRTKKDLRKNLTEAEKKLWYGYLRTLPCTVLRQKPIKNYVVDFYIPKLKFVIEIDGDTHFTQEGKIHDEKRIFSLFN